MSNVGKNSKYLIKSNSFKYNKIVSANFFQIKKYWITNCFVETNFNDEDNTLI